MVMLKIKANAKRLRLMLKRLMLKANAIDILYTLDSASNYSAIQKLKP